MTTYNGYDAVLIVSFGGPEGMDDVMPFLENVLRGRNVPHERMLEVSHHYEQFGGVSPINAQNRDLIAALEPELAAAGLDLPVYWGNRNWHPMLEDTLRQMRDDGIKHAVAFLTSAFSSYSGCRQYREDIARAQAAVGEGAPEVTVLRKFFNHPGFIEPMQALIQDALDQIPAERRAAAHLAFTAHSIPLSMAKTSRYEAQLTEASTILSDLLNHPRWSLVYQSRSGSPHQPWLEPDICDHLEALHAQGVTDVVIIPIGFISDHMEVLFDLDTEAADAAKALGMTMIRAATVGVHPRFIRMIRELIEERISGTTERPFLGTMGAGHDICPQSCCRIEPVNRASEPVNQGANS